MPTLPLPNKTLSRVPLSVQVPLVPVPVMLRLRWNVVSPNLPRPPDLVTRALSKTLVLPDLRLVRVCPTCALPLVLVRVTRVLCPIRVTCGRFRVLRQLPLLAILPMAKEMTIKFTPVKLISVIVRILRENPLWPPQTLLIATEFRTECKRFLKILWVLPLRLLAGPSKHRLVVAVTLLIAELIPTTIALLVEIGIFLLAQIVGASILNPSDKSDSLPVARNIGTIKALLLCIIPTAPLAVPLTRAPPSLRKSLSMTSVPLGEVAPQCLTKTTKVIINKIIKTLTFTNRLKKPATHPLFPHPPRPYLAAPLIGSRTVPSQGAIQVTPLWILTTSIALLSVTPRTLVALE